MEKSFTVVYTELDCVGNVRHLHSEATADHPGDLGGYSYSAFGKQLGLGEPGGIGQPGDWQPFRWKGKRLLSLSQNNLDDSRARVWSADLGAFLQPDEYVFLTPSGTLWSWPGQSVSVEGSQWALGGKSRNRSGRA